MVQKLRKRFILVAMLSTLIVLLSMIGGMNILNFHKLKSQADTMTRMICENDGKFPQNKNADEHTPVPDGNKTPPKSNKNTDNLQPPKVPDGQIDAETPFSTRYFSVKVNNKGKITQSNLNSIASVNSNDLDSYISAVKTKKSDTGFYRQFRYKKYKTTSYIMYIFVDCNQSLSTFKNTLFTSFLMSGIGFIAVLILVIIFSKVVLRPVAQSYEKQRQFITDAGHELKTPLTIIDANTEVIEMENGESQWTKSIRNQVTRLTTMVGQFITLSKMEENGENFNKTNIALNVILQESLEPFNIIFTSKNIKVKTTFEKDTHMYGDEKLIRQLFEILIDNAAKYADQNSTFNIFVKRKGKKNLIIFENESNNIFQGNLDMLFDRFYRTDASRNSSTGGSGIGLSIAKSIISLHGGTIHAKSSDGQHLQIIILI